jgi:enoyl-CoA hydratase/carnithine racemase
MMAAETWMDAAKAKELGFADEVVDEQEPDEDDKPAASASPVLAAIAQTQARITSLPAMRRESQMRKHRIAASLDPSRASPGTATK